MAISESRSASFQGKAKCKIFDIKIGKYCFTAFICICRCGEFKSKETRLCETYESTFTLNSHYIHPCSCFYLIVNENSRNNTKNCPWRLTAVDMILFRLKKLEAHYTTQGFHSGQTQKPQSHPVASALKICISLKGWHSEVNKKAPLEIQWQLKSTRG